MTPAPLQPLRSRARWPPPLTLATAILALLLLPASAAAHAHVVASEPRDGATLPSAPTEVRLQFSGPVVAGSGSVEVFAPDQARVDQGHPGSGARTTVVQPITASLHGTYGVAYRVSSEDGHVVTGAFTFVVVAASHGGDDAAAASRDAAKVDPALQGLFSAARFVELLALLVAAGAGLFACVIAPGWRPRLLVTSLVTLLVAYALGLVVNVAIVRDTTLVDALSRSAIRSIADTPFGSSLTIRTLVAIVAIAPALLLRYGPPLGAAARVAVAIVFVGLAASLSITGHAVTTEPTWLRMPLDMVHVTAAAIWLGGLVQLAWLAPFASAHVDAITRFSRIAFASVVVLLLTGTYAAYAELGLHPAELLDSRYGRLIFAKLVLYVGTMPLAWNNMTAFVPQVRRRPDDAPRMLRQYVWRECGLLVVVVALTVWLIATPQPG